MSANYVQKFYSDECQPSGHQLSHQIIAKLRQLMVGEGLRAQMSSVVQLWSKTSTVNLWLRIHNKIICVITDGTDGRDFCFVRFFNYNLKTIYFEVNLNENFVFETRSSVFYVLSGSDGQSIGIKFDNKLEAKDFKIIILEKKLKRFEKLFECKPSSDLPSNTRLKTVHKLFPKTSFNLKNGITIADNRTVVGLASDPTLDSILESGFTRLSKFIQSMDLALNQLVLDVRHRRHTYQKVLPLKVSAMMRSKPVDVMDVIHEEDSDEEHTTITSKANQPIDISLSSGKGMDTPAITGDNQSTTGSDSDKETEVSYKRFQRGVPFKKSLLYEAIHKSYHLAQQIPESVIKLSEKLAAKSTIEGHENGADDSADQISDTEESDQEFDENSDFDDIDNHSDDGSDGNVKLPESVIEVSINLMTELELPESVIEMAEKLMTKPTPEADMLYTTDDSLDQIYNADESVEEVAGNTKTSNFVTKVSDNQSDGGSDVTVKELDIHTIDGYNNEGYIGDNLNNDDKHNVDNGSDDSDNVSEDSDDDRDGAPLLPTTLANSDSNQSRLLNDRFMRLVAGYGTHEDKTCNSYQKFFNSPDTSD